MDVPRYSLEKKRFCNRVIEVICMGRWSKGLHFSTHHFCSCQRLHRLNSVWTSRDTALVPGHYAPMSVLFTNRRKSTVQDEEHSWKVDIALIDSRLVSI